MYVATTRPAVTGLVGAEVCGRTVTFGCPQSGLSAGNGYRKEHIDYHLDVNVKGVIWTVQKALPLMRPGGSIILNASIVASKGWANWSVYSASKGGGPQLR